MTSVSTVEKLLSIDDVSKILGIPVRTLRLWRAQGRGPKGAVYGKHLRYRPSEIERFQRAKEREG